MSGGVSWMGPAEAAEFERLTLAAYDDYDEGYTPDASQPCHWCGSGPAEETPLTRSKVIFLCAEHSAELVAAFAPDDGKDDA